MAFDSVLQKLNEYIDSQNNNQNNFETDGIFISGKSQTKNFNRENFNILPDTLIQNKEIKNIFFIDGGTQAITSTQNFIISFNRTGYVKFSKETNLTNQEKPSKNNKINQTEITEFYTIIRLKPNKETSKFEYDIDIIPEKNDSLILTDSINLKQNELEQEAPDVKKVANIVRRLEELFLVLKLSENNKDLIIVLDGSIEPKTDRELELFQKIKETSKKNNNVVLGISKTNSLITRQGRLVGNSLNQISPKDKNWFYCDFPDTENTKLCFAKLNPKAKYVFMVDFAKTDNLTDEKIKDTLILLATHSKDSVFLGYPYGLIKIDDFVRVTNNEAQYLKLKLESKTDNKTLLAYLKSNSDAHSILDTIKF